MKIRWNEITVCFFAVCGCLLQTVTTWNRWIHGVTCGRRMVNVSITIRICTRTVAEPVLTVMVIQVSTPVCLPVCLDNCCPTVCRSHASIKSDSNRVTTPCNWLLQLVSTTVAWRIQSALPWNHIASPAHRPIYSCKEIRRTFSFPVVTIALTVSPLNYIFCHLRS